MRIRLAAAGQPNGASENPQLSADGRFVAFDSTATNLGPHDPNGPQSDVYLYDQQTGAIQLISTGPAGAGADGASTHPAVAANGSAVAFSSRAHNLVPGGTSLSNEVFAWSPTRGIRQVSVSSDGTQADAPSDQPDVSNDGQSVVFSSAATNLVPISTNGHRNVFVHDLRTGTTVLVSVAPDGTAGSADSTAPAISPDGRYVSFATTATNLVGGVTPTRPCIVVRDLFTGTTQLASVSSSGELQNASVAPPFTQVSDISAGGRYVVFDSDATNLVRGDRNNHTDVFVHDMVSKTTVRASLATTDQEGGSDSFAPTITGDGRFVTFESFASNLTPFEPTGPNVFVRDLHRHTTVMGDVSSSGQPRAPERVKGLLQRPSISDDGTTMAFVSSAANLVAGDTNRLRDVFLRRLTPAPATVALHKVGLSRGHIVVTFVSGDRQAGPLLCLLDRRPASLCPLGPTALPSLRRGRHVLRAYAGGQGTVYASRPTVVRIDLRGGRARVRVTNPGSVLGLG